MVSRLRKHLHEVTPELRPPDILTAFFLSAPLVTCRRISSGSFANLLASSRAQALLKRVLLKRVLLKRVLLKRVVLKRVLGPALLKRAWGVSGFAQCIGCAAQPHSATALAIVVRNERMALPSQCADSTEASK